MRGSLNLYNEKNKPIEERVKTENRNHIVEARSLGKVDFTSLHGMCVCVYVCVSGGICLYTLYT